MPAAHSPPPDSHSPPIRPLSHYWADERGRRKFVDALFDSTAGDYDHVERLLAFGTGPGYCRDALRRAGLRAGMAVLDIATGTGLVAREALAITGETGSVIGLDPSTGMLEQARRGLPIPLIQATGERLPFRDASFDFVSMGFALRHVADLGLLFHDIRRVLRPGGTACILEISRPPSRARAGALRIFMTKIVPVMAGNATKRAEARRLMQFYWDTIDACVRPEAVLQALAEAGFPAPLRNVTLGLFSEYTAGNPVSIE